jgi:N,N'-diacetylchitobiose phosphorylase
MKYGYFDNKSREYVIERCDVPVSWTNYLGVRDLCTVISHNAGGYSFYKSSESGRVTRFRPNGVPLDRPGHYVYLRDSETGEYWTISWQPVGKDLEKAKYECRHGLSYSKFSCKYNGIEAEKILFIPIDDNVELWDVKIKNTGNKQRKISLFSYLEFSFHTVEVDNQNYQMSLYASGSSYADHIIEYDFFYEPNTFHYHTASFNPDSFDCLRDKFIGSYRTETNPLAVEKGICSNSFELTGNHCGALQKEITLNPCEEVRVVFMLGVGNRQEGLRIRKKYSDFTNVDNAFTELKEYWNNKLEIFQCKTPHEGLDTMINIWTLYQAETCIVWSRFASFIEVGGRVGLGYRDTSQDAMSVVHTNPSKCKQRFIELLRGQVSSGYGLHLFDPDIFDPEKQNLPRFISPTVKPMANPKDVIHGLAETCSDDHLWIIVSICEYVKETGDLAFFDEQIPFADGGTVSVYEHLKKALDFSAEHIGKTGICKGLRADWNDCLNLGGGESAMVSFMHHWALLSFLEASKFLHKNEDVERYTKMAEKVKLACEKELWDGEWYLRGFTKKGIKIGTHEHEEGKIFLNGQSWAVYGEVASKERGIKCMDSVYKHLFSKYGIHLVASAYSKPNDDIGYITRVYKGVKENGAIFSHPNPWAVIAECKLGRGKRAMEFYDSLLPYNQNDLMEIREAEPYSYCQFIMGKDHTSHGKARHAWLTGSGGWNYIAATHFILGIQVSFDGLVIDPCIPADWKSFVVTRKWRNATFNITVNNPDGVEKGIKSIVLNGKQHAGAISQQAANSVNEIIATMG